MHYIATRWQATQKSIAFQSYQNKHNIPPLNLRTDVQIIQIIVFGLIQSYAFLFAHVWQTIHPGISPWR